MRTRLWRQFTEGRFPKYLKSSYLLTHISLASFSWDVIYAEWIFPPMSIGGVFFLNSRVVVATVVIYIFLNQIVYVEVQASWPPPGLEVIELSNAQLN